MTDDDVGSWIIVGHGVHVPINTFGVEYRFNNGQVTRDGMMAFEFHDKLVAYRIVSPAALSALPERELLREALNALEPFASIAKEPFAHRDLRRARAAADKIRAALEHQP